MNADASLKILVIDDDATQQILAKEYLGAEGFVVRIAGDAKKGLSLAARVTPDVILLDLILPTVDGYEICKELKRRAKTANIPIILITGSRDQDVIQRGLAAGASDFVTKPVDWDFLTDRIKHVLRQHEGQTASHPASNVVNQLASSQVDPDPKALQEKDGELESLQAALAAAEGKILTLTKELDQSVTAQAASQAPAFSEPDVQGLISQIEEEWSARLHDAVSQVNKRAEARCQGLKLNLENLSAQNETAQRQLAQQLDTAIQENDALLRQKDKLEELARLAVAESAAKRQQDLDDLQLDFEQKAASIWNLVECNMRRQRDVLHLTEASIGDLRRLTVGQPAANELHASLDQINVSMSSCASKINKLRNLSIYAGDLVEPVVSTFSLNQLVDGHVNTLGTQTGRTDVKINNALQSDLNLNADQDAISLAMQCVLENALKFSPPNGSIEVHSSIADDGGLLVNVVDHGFGVDSALLEEISTFLSAEGTATPTGTNLTGDGLPMAKTIVKRHGGHLTFESLLGQGAAIAMTFPKTIVVPASVEEDGAEIQKAS